MLRHPLTWLGLLLLLVVAALWDRSPNELMQPEVSQAPEFPRAYMVNMDSKRFDTEGRLNYHLASEQAKHFQPNPRRATNQDYTLIERPRVRLHPADAAPWRARANQGRSDSDAENVLLQGEVRAWQDDEQGFTEITTSELWLQPSKQYAHTDKAVKMRAAEGSTNAVGIQADLGAERIELLKQVRSLFQLQESETTHEP